MVRTSAQRKFARGVEQVKTLRREAETFENANAYVFRPKIESRSANHIKYRCFAVEREAPDEDWPLLAGEALQNLRHSLDHAVCARVKRPTTRTQFPIFKDPCEFQVTGTPMIKGVPQPIRAGIENAQPYRVLPNAPAQAPIEWLRTLTNCDKHRTLATVASAVQHEAVGTSGDVQIFWDEPGTGKKLGSGETYVSTFTATSESEIEEVDVEPLFAYEVRIERRPLRVILKSIVDAVYRALYECEQGKPLSPHAPYPLN